MTSGNLEEMDQPSYPPRRDGVFPSESRSLQVLERLTRRDIRTLQSLGRDFQILRGAGRVLAARVRNHSVSDQLTRFLGPLVSLVEGWTAGTPDRMPLRIAMSPRGPILSLGIWKQLSTTGPPSAATAGDGAKDPSELMSPELAAELSLLCALVHLPILRGFLGRNLRRTRFERLRRVLPTGWFLDADPLPPGAVIPGLGITAWQKLARTRRADQTFVMVLFAAGTSPTWIRLDSSVPTQEWDRQITEAMRSFPIQPALLLEIPKESRDSPTLLTEYEFTQNYARLAGARFL